MTSESNVIPFRSKHQLRMQELKALAVAREQAERPGTPMQEAMKDMECGLSVMQKMIWRACDRLGLPRENGRE